ncbi:MAG TPA: hypothetical protein VNK73_20405 [Actinomycetota bacterium]|nr:hypothetical protein [Actinomycetota bacterium]
MGRRAGAWLLALVVLGGLGVGGVLVARSSGSREPPVLELATVAVSASDAATAPARDLAPAQPGASGYLVPRVRYEFATDLPDLPDEARAWRLDPKVTDERVAALARALGFKAKPTATQSGWRVFEGGKLLQVSRAFGAPWTYAAGVNVNCAGIGGGEPDAAVSSDGVVDCAPPVVPIKPPRPCPPRTACAQPRAGTGQEPATPGSAGATPGAVPGSASGSARGSAGSAASGTDPSGGGSTGTGKPVPSSAGQPVDDICRLNPAISGCRWPAPRPSDLPSRQEAERIARDWFAKAGVRLDGSTVRVVQQWSQWVVTASPQVEGRPTIGFAAEVWIGGKGQVAHGSGWLSEPEAGANYPLIGVKEALDRLQNRRTWFARSLSPGVPAGAIQRCRPNLNGVARCQDVVKRITDVRLGLQHTPVLAAGGRAGRDAWLVPAYFFEINGNPDQIESVIAVADRYMKIPQPQPEPAPARPVPTPPPTHNPDIEPAGGGGSGSSGAG